MSSANTDTRTRILMAALKLLEADDGSAVRMSDIAKEAGISRQAVYLHFPTRAELLVAATLYLDEIKDIDGRLAASRNAPDGTARLAAYIDAWGNYIPEIYGVARALLAMQATDEAAKLALAERMQAVRHGCAAVVQALGNDGILSPDHSAEQATDILWTMLSIRNWEQLTIECGWSQEAYIEKTKVLATACLVSDEN